jgi:hypothetical protein
VIPALVTVALPFAILASSPTPAIEPIWLPYAICCATWCLVLRSSALAARPRKRSAGSHPTAPSLPRLRGKRLASASGRGFFPAERPASTGPLPRLRRCFPRCAGAENESGQVFDLAG